MTKNIAHRGYSARYPENTMLAFEKASKYDGIELDVHMSKDGHIIVIHDETVNRTTNGKGMVKDMTLTELKSLEINMDQRIPTFDEYLCFWEKTSLLTNIELKNDIIPYEGMEERVIAAVRARGLEHRTILSSFNHLSIMKCKAIAPEIPCAFLTYAWLIDVGAYTKRHGIGFVHPLYTSLTDEAIKEIHSNGIAINPYTVNDPKEMKRLISHKVSGIITDDPELLNNVIETMN